MTPDGYWPFEDAPAEFNPTAVAVDYINWAQGYPDGWRGSDEMEIAHLAVVEASVRFLTHFVDPQMNMRDALSAYSLTPHGRMLAVASANA